MRWLLKGKKENDRRTKQGEAFTTLGAKTISKVARVICTGSANLISVRRGTKVVLVLTDTKHYKTLGSKDFGKGLPAKVETFRKYMSYAGYAAGIGRTCHKKHYTPKDLAFAQQLQTQYPKGFFFFAKSKLAQTELFKAIGVAQSGPAAQILTSPQPQNQKPQNKAKKVSRRKTRPQEESDDESESEESESEESDETDELENAEEEGMDSSDVEIVVPKEKEEDSSDVEIVEAPKAPNTRPSPRRKSSKRVRSISFDEDSDNGTPPSPPPKSARKQVEQPVQVKLSREVQGLRGSRLKSRTKLQEAQHLIQKSAAQRKSKQKAREERNGGYKAIWSYREQAEFADKCARRARRLEGKELHTMEGESESESEAREKFEADFAKLMELEKSASWR